ncbi:MAG: hypothetical protein ACLS3Z_06535 [Faecalibacterium sp.]
MKLTMAAKTPAQWKTLFENVPFHRENYYTGPLGPDYTPRRHLSSAVGPHRRSSHRDLVP